MSRSLEIELPGSASHREAAALEDFPDGVLLDRFLADRDQEAFESIVLKHGPKVLRLCRRTLGNGQDADDAFQATFLVLIHRAGDIRLSDNVGGWLLGVARRVALRAKTRADQRRTREGAAMDAGNIPSPEEPSHDDLFPMLRAEVDRLPEKYRRPIELCYWEGLSSEQAARQLQCPTGTVKWRLSRAREILRARLGRLVAVLALLLMWRLPASATRAESLAPEDVARQRFGRAGGGRRATSTADDSLPEALLLQTSDLATFLRDTSLPFMKARSRPNPRKRWGIATLLKIQLVAAILWIPATPVFHDLTARIHKAFFGVSTARACH